MKANYHTHTTWCDGRETPEAMIRAAIARGFDEIGFSSHARLPDEVEGNLTPASAVAYAREIRALAAKYAGRIRVLLGVEADYIPGGTTPERARYAHLGLDYLIGSVHTVIAPDGAPVSVDDRPELLSDGIRDHFGGDAEAFLRAYFAENRDMAAAYDFDVVGHPDLVRKFNGVLGYFDETAPWYLEELRLTADALAASGKIVEVNTGGISRGWMDDAYPSPTFRALLRARGVPFILSSDAHAASGLDCAFDRFATAERFVRFRPELCR
ncbi:MAG: histidinol-phosphatase [Kiritimatiellia bacterium]